MSLVRSSEGEKTPRHFSDSLLLPTTLVNQNFLTNLLDRRGTSQADEESGFRIRRFVAGRIQSGFQDRAAAADAAPQPASDQAHLGSTS